MFYILRDTSVYKIPSAEQGDGSALAADLSRADAVLHRAGLTGGRSVQPRTGSVPLAPLVPT